MSIKTCIERITEFYSPLIQVATMELLVVKDAKDSSSAASGSSWVTPAEATRIAPLQSTTETDVSTVDCRNVWQWA